MDNRETHNHSQKSDHTHAHGHKHEMGTEHVCISVVPIFNHLEEDQMHEIMGVTQSVLYKKGEIIYREGDHSDSLIIVSQGKIKIYRLSESGKEQLIRILNAGDFSGELALFKDSIREAYAEAMEETRICTIKRSELNELLLKYPSISLKILSEFSIRLGQSEKQTTRFGTEKVETRIALFLAECLDENEQTDEIELPMSKKDLASYLGTSPETISRKLSEFENAGLIRQKTNKIIKIIDLDGLLFV